ncbi:hypothetical protein M3Y94_00540800 [Aphelenchoides besseyi]|nr:hypothetical protein M3Y94_00540800 [Aphelenchoides besseyi]
MISAVDVESPTTILFGCESRSLLKHVQNRVEIKENETAWQLSEPFVSQLRCHQIVNNTMEPDINGTIRECVDFEYRDEFDVERQAKLCCCRGTEFCNEEISWQLPGRFVGENVSMIKEQNKNAASDSLVSHAIVSTISIVLIIAFHLFEVQ